MARNMSIRLRFAVLNRDHFTCRYCGAKPGKAELHVDHVKPVSKGGSNRLENLVTACQTCNLGKHTAEILPTLDAINSEYVEWLRERIEEISGRALDRNVISENILSMVCWAPGYDYALAAIEAHADSFRGDDRQLSTAICKLPVLAILEAEKEGREIDVWLAENGYA